MGLCFGQEVGAHHKKYVQWAAGAFPFVLADMPRQRSEFGEPRKAVSMAFRTARCNLLGVSRIVRRTIPRRVSLRAARRNLFALRLNKSYGAAFQPLIDIAVEPSNSALAKFDRPRKITFSHLCVNSATRKPNPTLDSRTTRYRHFQVFSHGEISQVTRLRERESGRVMHSHLAPYSGRVWPHIMRGLGWARCWPYLSPIGPHRHFQASQRS